MKMTKLGDPIRDGRAEDGRDGDGSPSSVEPMVCPFCAWEAAEGEYAMLLHMETLHPEEGGDSAFNGSFTSDNSRADESDLSFVECRIDGCGEMLRLDAMDYHLELHTAETVAELDDEAVQCSDPRIGPSSSSSSGPSRAHRDAERQRRAESSQAKPPSVWNMKRFLRFPDPTPASSSRSSKHHHHHHREPKPSAPPDPGCGKRLGKAQLGAYAHEHCMPDWLVSLLKNYHHVESRGVVPVLAQLLEQCPATKYAYLCHPGVHRVSKLKREGGFCGYRNIQMMTSYINSVGFPGHQNLKDKIPSIFQIQDFIESAWDAGINPQGRVETGGIKGTRKYIGTPEALVMFRLLDIPCDAQALKSGDGRKAEALLLDWVENYFQSGVVDPTQRVRLTNMPPIYLQHAGHSMTIIGFERLRNGVKNLIVFDPMFRDTTKILKYVGRQFETRFPDMSLRPYRRSHSYLRRYHEYELITLRAPPGGFPPAPAANPPQ